MSDGVAHLYWTRLEVLVLESFYRLTSVAQKARQVDVLMDVQRTDCL
jgi:hypothetical protein